MKRKILVSILLLSLSASLVGCKTSSPNPNANSKAADSQMHTDTDTANNGSDNDTDTGTDTDTADEKNESISTEDIKELDSDNKKNTDTDTSKDKSNDSSPTPSSIQVGGVTLEAELIPLDSSFNVSDMETLDSALFGDTLYILDNKNLHSYTVADSSAVKSNDIKLNSKYERVDADTFGNIYLSDSRFNAAMLNDDGTLTELDLTGKLSMSKVMNFGLSCNGKNSIQKYIDGEIEKWDLGNVQDNDDSNNSSDGNSSEENENQDESQSQSQSNDDDAHFTKITDIEFVGNHILAGGNFNDGKNTLRAAIYDYDGNQISLTDNKILGSSINSMTETDNGIIVSSGSNLSLWTSDGTEIGQTKSSETKELFGTENPVWINDVFAMDDGSVLALCSGEKDNGKTEALLYKLWGF